MRFARTEPRDAALALVASGRPVEPPPSRHYPFANPLSTYGKIPPCR